MPPRVAPKSKTIRVCINKPTEDNLKVRAVQIGVPKEVLVGHILESWCAKAHTQSDEFRQVKDSLA